MVNYPFISIIITADCSLPQIEQSLESLSQLSYPKDRLEFLMIMPPLRPIPKILPHINSRLSIIQFDSGMDWSKEEGRIEGLSLAKGRYIQFIDACLNLKTKWFKEALTIFVRKKIVGVEGFVSQSDVMPEGPISKHNELLDPNKSLLLKNGLFDKKMLKYLLQNGKRLNLEKEDSANSDQFFKIPIKMAVSNYNSRYSNHQIKPLESQRMLRTFTKFIFARNHV